MQSLLQNERKKKQQQIIKLVASRRKFLFFITNKYCYLTLFSPRFIFKYIIVFKIKLNYMVF